LVGVSQREHGEPDDDPATEEEGRVMDHETLLRCLGYAIDFLQIIAMPVLLLAITGRLAR
jgi:hypothetical protein